MDAVDALYEEALQPAVLAGSEVLWDPWGQEGPGYSKASHIDCSDSTLTGSGHLGFGDVRIRTSRIVPTTTGGSPHCHLW